MDARDEKATGTGAPPPIPFDRELLDALTRAGGDRRPRRLLQA